VDQLTTAFAQTVQQYIDEPPIWRDGTSLRAPPMTAMQFRIWALAAAGKLLEGIVLFATGVALPLVGARFALNHIEHGLVASATLFGILIAATALGGFVDKYGCKKMFVVEIAIFLVFLIGVSISSNFRTFLICLFGMGLALGCDYPVAHVIISESIPSPIRGRMVLGAFAFQSVGAIVGTLIGFSVLAYDPSLDAWRWMYAIGIVPTAFVIILRLTIPESPHFLFFQGRVADAERALARQLARDPPYPPEIRLKESVRPKEGKRAGYLSLFSRKHRRATILASLP